MLEDLLRYTAASSQNGERIRPLKIETFVPSPNEDDLRVGYIRRYFVQKTNDKDAPIYEVSEDFSGKVQDNPMYKVVSIKWKLKGVPQDIMDSNRKSVLYVYNLMPKLELYLPNLLQFAKVD